MRHFLNNIEVSPRNVLEIGLNTDFSGNPEILSIDTDKIKLPREAMDIIQSHIATQGVFEGIPYNIITEGGVNLEYYVDLTDQTLFKTYDIEVKIKKRQGKDLFFEKAEGLSFELMADKGVNFDLFNIPYLIIPDNIPEMGLNLSIALFVMTKELIQSIKDLATAIANLVEAVTPNVGVPPVPPLGEIISLSIQVLAQLAYTIAIVIAIKKLGDQMFELVYPKVRKYLGATIQELIQKGCDYLGFTLESNLLEENKKMTLMPVPLTKDKKSIFNFLENDLDFSFTKGYPTAQDSISTLGELINAVEIWFNARTKVYQGKVQIERRDYWQILTTNTLIPSLTDQDNRSNEYQLNTEEAWKRTYIHYQVDYSDLHTLDFFDPTDAEYSTEPLNVINQDLVTIKGLNDINIPFALAVRKNELNWVEEKALDFFQSLDNLVGVLGFNSNLSSIVGDRLGVTQISSQFYSITKVLYAQKSTGKQNADYTDYIKASEIYAKYHTINEITVNGYKIFNEVAIRINSSEFVNLLDNNFAYINGVLCEILSINYIDEQSKAIISYKEPYNYAQGKVEIITLNS